MITTDPYELLGLPRDADAASIKSAWRRESKRTHPDHNGSGLQEEFRAVQEAYTLLKDPEARSRYDQRSAPGPTPSGGGSGGSGPTSSSRERAGGSGAGAGRARSAPHAPPRQQHQAPPHQAPPRPAPQPTPPPPHQPPHQAQRGPTYHPRPEPTMGADPSRLSWAQRRYEDSIRVTPRQMSWLRWVPAGASLVATLAWVNILNTLNGMVQTSAQAGVLLLGACAVLSATRFWPLATIGFVLAVTTGAFGYYSAGTEQTIAWGVALGAIVAANLARAARPVLSPKRVDDTVGEKLVRKCNIFGTPGTPGHMLSAETQIAARMADDALLALTWFPATRTFHGPVYDGVGHATSHVVVCGRRVAVVDSLVWSAGRYGFTTHGAITCDGNHFPFGANRIREAVAAWEDKLPGNVEVRGWVMLGSTVGPVVIDEVARTPPSGEVRLGTPQEVLEEVGSWFAEGDPHLVDRRILVELADGILARR